MATKVTVVDVSDFDMSSDSDDAIIISDDEEATEDVTEDNTEPPDMTNNNNPENSVKLNDQVSFKSPFMKFSYCLLYV